MLYQQVRPPFWRHHPILTGTAALVAVWWIANGWYAPLAFAGVVGLLLFVNRRRRARAARNAGLRARAEYEHRLNMAGDPRGLYGRYPPVQPGWFPDPVNRYRMRYFDGAMWTGWTQFTVRR